jgi:putative acetyltransferase
MRKSYNHSKAWVLELDRQIIGFASTIEQREDNKTLLIGLYVSKQYQNQGNGKKLLNKVKSLSNKIIELAVYQENTRAYEFYKRHGFSIKKESFEDGHKYLEMSWTKPKP